MNASAAATAVPVVQSRRAPGILGVARRAVKVRRTQVGLGLTGVVLLIGFYIYMRYIRGNRQAPAPISAEDQALLDRYRSQLGDDADEPFDRPKK